jgi:uncharacterized protein involved in exopolysaccharide biosynthesis
MDANLKALDRLQLDIQRSDDALARLTEQKASLQRQMATLEREYAALSESEIAAISAEDPLVRQLMILETRLVQLQTQYTDQFPEVVHTKAQIEELKKKLGERGYTEHPGRRFETIPSVMKLRDQITSTEREIKALDVTRGRIEEDMTEYQKRVESTPSVEQELQKLERDYVIMQTNYQNLLQKQMNAQLSESLERRQKGEQFRVIDPANLPTVPVSPNRMLICILGALFGLGMGAGLSIGIDMLWPRFYSAADVSAVLGVPVLAVIPHVKEVADGGS